MCENEVQVLEEKAKGLSYEEMEIIIKSMPDKLLCAETDRRLNFLSQKLWHMVDIVNDFQEFKK